MTPRRARLARWIAAFAALAAFVCLKGGRGPRASGSFPQSAYVWQRVWSPAVVDAVTSDGPRFDSLVVLAAEVAFEGERLHVVRVRPDFETLRRLDGVGLSIRIGPYSGRFDAVRDDVVTLAERVVADAHDAGLRPRELEVDFDCPSSRLADYRSWVDAIKAKSTIPVSITALPTWLDRDGFAALAHAAPDYVLQVHSLEIPTARSPRPLVDPDAAILAIDEAGTFGVPFRVALPTYAYEIAFDPSGRRVGLRAEGPRGKLAGATAMRVSSDPAAIATLVAKLRDDRPKAMEGLIWYRLPTKGDEMNWAMPALAAVMQGRAPASMPRVTASRVEPGLFEIGVVNDGEADAAAPLAIGVHWHHATRVASDAFGDFRVARSDARSIELELDAARGRLRAGEARTIGWVRLSSDDDASAEVERAN